LQFQVFKKSLVFHEADLNLRPGFMVGLCISERYSDFSARA
jgi:hypothetical protein